MDDSYIKTKSEIVNLSTHDLTISSQTVKPEPLKNKTKSLKNIGFDIDFHEDKDIKSAVEWLIIEDVKIKKKIAKIMVDLEPGIALKIGTYLQMMTINKEKAFEDVMEDG